MVRKKYYFLTCSFLYTAMYTVLTRIQNMDPRLNDQLKKKISCRELSAVAVTCAAINSTVTEKGTTNKSVQSQRR